jgi:serine/threonine protein kinase
MPLAAGSRVGAYEVLGSLGAGGMGEVYRAQDKKLGREVALKILPEAFASDRERLARFDREAKTLASLNHPHIAHIYGFEESGSTRALVLELVDGETLAERIARGSISISEALAIARQIADGLDAAHEKGVIHRDLKPANIKLRPDGVVKVLDFGLAKVFTGEGAIGDESPTRTDTRTRVGTVLGTTAYMSPEQARGRSVDKRADIWSFGCVLYEMLSGRRAFAGETRSDTVVAILEREPDWHALPPLTPPHVRQLLRRCLEKDLKHRLRDIGDAAIEPSPDQDAKSVIAHPDPPRTHGLRPWIAMAASFALIGAASTAMWLWSRAPSPALKAVPLTTYPGFESHPSLSPDGNQVAFTWNGERQNNFDLYVKLVGPGRPLQLTTNPAVDTSPAWSPDGRWIAFLRVLPKGRAAVMLVPALGGPERQLGEISASGFIAEPDFGYGLCWSSDSASLIVTDVPSSTEAGGLFAWSVATGERRRLTSLPPKQWMDFGPALSADGRSLAFARLVGFGISDLYLLPLGDALQPRGEAKRLTYLNRFTTSPAWMPHGREIVFGSGSLTSGAVDLFAVDATAREGTPRRLNSIGEHATLVSISRPIGGRSRMVYAQSHFDPGIWQIVLPDRESKAMPVVSQSIPFLCSTRPEYQPQYSPDGQRVTFVSDTSGASEIWTCDKNGANLVQLTSAAWPETAAPRWSPDGSQIVFHARPEGPGDIFTIPASGGAPKRLTNDPADDWGATWSPDGQWIYFSSNRSGRFEVWKTPVNGGTAVQVSKNGGSGPTASPDGRYTYYAKGSELWSIPVNGSDERRVLESLGDWSRFAVTAGGIYFMPVRPALAKTSVEYTIEFFSFSSQQIRTVAQFEKPPFLGLTISPDGRRLLYSQIDQSGMDLMLVEDVR